MLDGKTPYELMHHAKPDLADLPEWGKRVFILKGDRGKFKPKVDEGQWVGFSDESKGRRIYLPGKHQVTVELNVTFNGTILVVKN